MTPTLSLGGLADLGDIIAISGRAFDPRFGEAWSASQLQGTLCDGNSWLRLARDGVRPVGFSLSRRIVDEAELLLIAVVPEARGHGLGRDLLAATIGDARARGVLRMFLEMRDGNAAACALYRALGFVEVGRRSDYYRGVDQQRFDAITMRRPLNP